MLPLTRNQKLICSPQAYEKTYSQRKKPHRDVEPENDGIFAPTYLDAASIGKFTESYGYGSAPRAEASESTNEQRGESSQNNDHVASNGSLAGSRGNASAAHTTSAPKPLRR